ncbi:MAG: T9SS type A sorting domain-containing protein, partial [Ignavibacteriaceae bacterium]|nr:T9SS type A sorting domain-containing protein [Ignavibacteriaceae bacterium]
YLFSNPAIKDIGDVEVGTTSGNATVLIANYGDQDLEITDIPATVGDFNLESTLSFPLTLSSFDSLEIEFSFSPTVPGDTTVEYTISSNDPVFTGLTLTGNGYNMFPVLDKTIYASTGSQNNGDILTIDKTTGTGTTVGASLFSGIKDITIHPATGIMYGLVTRSGDADIVRVSAAGDAYLLHTISIPALAGIAFNTAGTLYGITSGGEIYTIDITIGTTTFVVTGEGSYSSITFNPVTNELWASSRSFIPPNKDAIFTVDLATGDTTIIGHTGLGEITNDIVFDENQNLYGVIGAASAINDFISIDASNGVGTVVGSVGMKNIQGLAFEETGVTSVEDDVNGTIPTDFSLKQNYPNPFNPTTTIQFSLPINSNVELVVFNMLGEAVATLLNEQRSAGTHSITWNSSNTNGVKLSSGIYFYKLNATGMNGKEFNSIRKMVLLK